MRPPPLLDPETDVAIVGAGFAGLYMVHRARQMGLTVWAFEAGSGVGGTWYWNRYPGARCDVESMQYSYSFSPELEQEWRWSERFAAQDEILRYAEHVADRFDLRRSISFDTRIVSASYDAQTRRWTLISQKGETTRARYCVLATGVLSAVHPPEIPGIDDFAGEHYHTGAWPHKPPDFEGKAIGLIGTGSSGIQATSVLARQARQLYVFQRTPNFVLTSANGPMTEGYEQEWKQDYRGRRARASDTRTGVLHDYGTESALSVSAEERTREYKARWHSGRSVLTAYTDLYLDLEANTTAADFLRSQIAAIVRDAQTASLLSPRTYPVGAKRVCIDNHYYEAFNRDNVTLVDIASDPIERFIPTGLRTAERAYDLDAIVFATGFDAVTGAILRIDVRGRDDRSLREEWKQGASAYLGLMSAGYPNLFMVNGPGSPAALSNALKSLEHHVDFIAGAIDWMERNGLEAMEPVPAAEAAWTEAVEEAGKGSIFEYANSWFKGANVIGKPRRFLVYVGGYNQYCGIVDQVVQERYRGFNLVPARQAIDEPPACRAATKS